MAASMIDSMAQQLGQEAMAGVLADRLGLDPRMARQAVKIGLPMIVAALARNAADEQGAGALAGALERDHDGSLLDDLGGYLQRGGDLNEGEAILGHVLGRDRGRIETEMGRETGLDPSVLSKLLPMLAPLVLAYLGRTKRQEQMSPGDLAGYLDRERDQIARQGLPRIQVPNPPSKSEPRGKNAGDLLGDLLDRDGDGSSTDDAARIGMDLLGKLLGGNKR